MRKPARFTVLLLLLTAVAGFVLAQGTTASLTGTVTSDGNPLPGATVTITSPSLQGTRVTVSGESGNYSIQGLPPGDYTVVFEMPGMVTDTQKVRLLLAQTTRADSKMSVSGVAETVDVKGTAEAVLETTQIATNFTSEEIGRLPVARTIVSTVLLAPGVSNTGVNNQVTISGAPSYDNVFLVDGVVVNENLRGQPHNLFIEDAIQETTILAGGVSAEYGRFTGGVVSTLTKSGGNTFSGSFRDSFSNPDWTEKVWEGCPTCSPVIAPEADHVEHTDQVYEATLGGRILKDHLWFFGAGRLAERSIQKFTAITNLPYTNGFDETRWEGKLTAQIASGHNFVATYLDITNDETNNAFGNVLDFASLVPLRSLPNTLLSLNYNGVITKNLLVELQYAKKEFTFENSGGLLTDRIGGTLLVDTNARRFHAPTFCGVCSFEERDNDSYLGKATYYLDTAKLGSHSIVGGVENFEETRLANNHQEGSDYRVSSVTSIVSGADVYPRFGSASVIQFQPIFSNSEGTDFQTISAFVNDKWDFNRHFSFNVGLRWDKNDGKDADGNTVSDDSAFSPRLGIAFDPAGNGRGRFTASYARYVAKIADGNVGGGGQAAGNPANITWNYRGPEINPAATCSATNTSGCLSSTEALTQLFAWFDSVGGTENRSFLNSSSIPGFSAVFPESLTSPSVDEITLGYGTQIGSNAYAKVDVVARDLEQLLRSADHPRYPAGRGPLRQSERRRVHLYRRRRRRAEVSGRPVPGPVAARPVPARRYLHVVSPDRQRRRRGRGDGDEPQPASRDLVSRVPELRRAPSDRVSQSGRASPGTPLACLRAAHADRELRRGGPPILRDGDSLFRVPEHRRRRATYGERVPRQPGEPGLRPVAARHDSHLLLQQAR